MQMIMYVINNPDLLDDVLDAWHDAGIIGVTIMESTGIYRRRPTLINARYAVGFPLLVDSMEKGHYTLFATLDDTDQVTRCLAATESVVGDLSLPNTGAFAAWELTLAKKTILPQPAREDDKETL
ncbi:MAG: hypothetical protein KBG20_14185 [Caldilineaceae bacterium]|nr:hypothetical protein [Caldilineaceae bacterium]MBP8108792.1 hypothetical protein [Caldilineaceae bacterium]MBP8123958.1 hypothetical protein [Caldilineaceae bacterium]MBP9073451.1 hypothetical protein [Caldilineaceae bacterium]